MTTNRAITAAAVVLLMSCSRPEQPAGAGGWLEGNRQQQMETVAKQLRGLDVTMMEMGYRYQELYWALQDQNWEYAAYQTEKLRTALENGLERRPKRAKSAEHFLQVALPQMQQATASRDTLATAGAFRQLTTSCNACHAQEQVPAFTVKEPLVRQSPIRK